MPKPITDRIYWTDADDSVPRPFGPHTAQIVDEDHGGTIAYCHFDNADRLVVALRAMHHADQARTA